MIIKDDCTISYNKTVKIKTKINLQWWEYE